jgi:apolipoprotein N-acyltransferase
VGWRRILVAIGFGCFGALAFPPISFFPILWLCFPALVVLLQGCMNWKQALVTGWAFSFGLLMCGLYWIAASMFVDIAQFWWAVPLSVAGLPAVFSIYYGVAMMLAWTCGVRGFSGVMGAALWWFLADCTRGHAFSGFPWNLEGYAWSAALPMLQITSVIGIYGLTLLTLAAAFLPALCLENGKKPHATILASLVVLALCGVWGETRLMQNPTTDVPGVRLRIVQPNVDQKLKWLPENLEPNFQELLDFTSAPGAKPITHIVWPETAATFYLAEDPARRAMIADHLPAGGSLISGVVRRDLSEASQLQFHNSLITIDSNGDVTSEYDKHHLVPFGEYIPYRSALPFALKPLIHMGVDFTPGDSAATLHVAGLPSFSPLVCYEVIFTGDVIPQNDRPQMLINVTNDGWYFNTAGPYQHFAMARVRAIEEGMPLVRSANTGISGVIDSYGRVTARLGIGIKGYTDADLPASIPPTFFERHRETPLWILFGALALGVILTRGKKKKDA